MSKLSRAVDYAIWAALGGLVIFVVTRRASGPDTGERAAAIDLPLANGKGRFRLEEQQGKAVLLEIFSSWCGACRRSAPTLADAYGDHRDDVRFVGVVVNDDPAEAARIQREWQIPFEVAIDDGSVSRAYDVKMLPTIVLIDQNGMVRNVTTGMPTRSQIESWIHEL